MNSGTALNAPTLETILDAASVIHAHGELEDADLVTRLREAGLSEMEAEHAIVFLPLAFGRPVLLRMGVTVSPSFIAETRAGKRVTLSYADQPWYVAALRVGVATVTHGYAAEGCAGETLSKAVFTSVLSRSVEIHIAGQLADEGGAAGTGITEVVLLRLPAEAFRRKRGWRFWK